MFVGDSKEPGEKVGNYAWKKHHLNTKLSENIHNLPAIMPMEYNYSNNVKKLALFMDQRQTQPPWGIIRRFVVPSTIRSKS